MAVERAARVAIQRIITGGRLTAARGVMIKRVRAGGRVEAGADVAKQRVYTGRCVPGPIEAVASERTRTHGGIVTAICIVLERTGTVGRVVAAGRVAQERVITSGSVEVGVCVVKERKSTDSRIEFAGVGIERLNTDSRVVAAGCESLESEITHCRVAASGICIEGVEGPKTLSRVGVGIAPVRCRSKRSSRR